MKKADVQVLVYRGREIECVGEIRGVDVSLPEFTIAKIPQVESVYQVNGSPSAHFELLSFKLHRTFGHWFIVCEPYDLPYLRQIENFKEYFIFKPFEEIENE